MNKLELIDAIAAETNVTKADCQRILDATFAITKSTLKRGGEVRLVGFGTFIKRKRAARKARNPKTGKEVRVRGQWIARFRPGKEFRSALN